MSFIDELFHFKDLPQWVSSRLSLVTKDFKDIEYDFYLEDLMIDHCKLENNKGSAIFLTSEEFIKVSFSLDITIIEKRNLYNLVKVIKQLRTPMEDVFKEQEVKWYSADLYFLDGDNMTLTSPLFTRADNLQGYKKLISNL